MDVAHPPLLKLGPFVLRDSLGRGGMAEVWHAYHEVHGTPVAVKVITTRKARDQVHRDAFYQEIRAVAGLSHPHILSVLDYGEVDNLAARHNPRLVEGSPWLAMELADGGNLTSRCGNTPWREVRRILLSLLDALAHAHARGVTHLDLKPDNVLLATTGELPCLKLADFGIAFAFDEVKAQEEPGPGRPPGDGVVGTPAYMAPELFTGDWRDFGPWSDLYALGCLAWQLVAGRTPFGGLTLPQQIRAQCFEEPGAFEPRVEVPSGLEGWLRTLLHKEPRRRFRRAADAAWMLLHLPEEGTSADIHSLPTPKINSHQDHWVTQVNLPRIEPTVDDSEDTGEILATMTLRVAPGEALPTGAAHPPVPVGWRIRENPLHNLLAEGGLGLFSLRRHPLIGREYERDQLWSLLREVHTTSSTRVAVVRGGTGTGKSRLALWLGERAHECGAATQLAAFHDREGCTHYGLLPMFARHLRCVGLTPPELKLRVERVLREWGITDPYDWKTLAELLIQAGGEGEDNDSAVRLVGEAERSMALRFALYNRLFRRLATLRPLIVWVDDAQWAPEALAWVRGLMEDGGPGPELPILVLVTVSTEVSSEEGSEHNTVADLLTRPGVSLIDLEQQTPSEQHTLVRGLLGLASPLVDEVLQRTHGNPLFVVQLVGDWVSRGILIPGPGGLVMAPGATVILPDSLHQIWLERMGRILADKPFTWQLSLVLMSLLGTHIQVGDWRLACTRAGIPSHPALLELLERNGLLYRDRSQREGTWNFVHGMFRESLERIARDSPQFATWHLACAHMLRERYPLEIARVAERMTHHLEQAGAFDEAAISLRSVIRGALSAGDIGLARRSVEHLKSWVDAGKLRRAPRETLQLRLLETDILKAARQFDAFIQAAEQVVGDIDLDGDPELRMESRGVLGRMWTLKGEFQRAGAAYAEGFFLAEQLGSLPLQAQYLLGLAESRMGQSHFDEALEYSQRAHLLVKGQGYPLIEIESASKVFDFSITLGKWVEGRAALTTMLRLAELLDNERLRSYARRGEGILAMKSKQLDLAERALQAAMAGFRRIGDIRGEGDTALDLAELLRKQGKAAEAEPLARMGYAIRTRAHGPDVDGSTPYNLAIVLVMCGKGQEAATLLNRSLETMTEHGQVGLLAAYHLLLALVAAQSCDWWLVDIHLAAMEQHLPQLAMPDPDDIWVATKLGQWAHQNKEYSRAELALRYALDFSLKLGRADDVYRVEQLLKGIPAG